MTPGATLDLRAFLPFRLNRLAAQTSRALWDVYGAAFGLDIPEWRVLATLGPHREPLAASDIVRSTRTHKSRISRAVATLTQAGLVERAGSGVDRREVDLTLTRRGRKLYEELVPLMLEREAGLLAGFDAADRATLFDLLARLESNVGVGGDDAA